MTDTIEAPEIFQALSDAFGAAAASLRASSNGHATAEAAPAPAAKKTRAKAAAAVVVEEPEAEPEVEVAASEYDDGYDQMTAGALRKLMIERGWDDDQVLADSSKADLIETLRDPDNQVAEEADPDAAPADDDAEGYDEGLDTDTDDSASDDDSDDADPDADDGDDDGYTEEDLVAMSRAEVVAVAKSLEIKVAKNANQATIIAAIMASAEEE